MVLHLGYTFSYNEHTKHFEQELLEPPPRLSCFSLLLCAALTWPLLPFQTVKGGISETRIEKRIVITGDADIDHDQVGNTQGGVDGLHWLLR